MSVQKFHLIVEYLSEKPPYGEPSMARLACGRTMMQTKHTIKGTFGGRPVPYRCVRCQRVYVDRCMTNPGQS